MIKLIGQTHKCSTHMPHSPLRMLHYTIPLYAQLRTSGSLFGLITWICRTKLGEFGEGETIEPLTATESLLTSKNVRRAFQQTNSSPSAPFIIKVDASKLLEHRARTKSAQTGHNWIMLCARAASGKRQSKSTQQK